jgi:hypothetical protein
VQLRELAQLNQDLIKDMDTMMEAVSAFVAVSSSADIADMSALIVIHHREYTDVVRAMRIMNETVRQWRATAHNLSQCAYPPSLRIAPSSNFLVACVLYELFDFFHVVEFTGSCPFPLASLQPHGGGIASMQSGAHFRQRI